jgi:Cu/Ag efflux protein CusF
MRTLRTIFIWIGCAALLLAAAGCQRPVRGRNYVVRAEVVQTPDTASGHTLFLHHEPIDDWVSRDGTMDGMDSMAMPFPVARSVPISELRAGDKVEVILHLDWQADRPVEITGLRKLSPGQILEFRAARPPSPPRKP